MLGSISSCGPEFPPPNLSGPYLCRRKLRGRARTGGSLGLLKAPCMICLNSRTTSSSSRSARVRTCPHRQSKFVLCSESQSSLRPKRINRSPHPHSSVIRPEHSTVLSGCSNDDCCCMRSPSERSPQAPGLERCPAAEGGMPPELHSTGLCPSAAPPSDSPDRGTIQPPRKY